MKVFKNKNNSLNGFFIFLAAAIFSIFTFAACEVGLGSAVDTQPPTVAIAYPPSLSIIRESFVFAGTWTDDMGVKTVHVDVYQSLDEGKKLVYSDEATVSEDGNWSIELNQFDTSNSKYYNGWQFSDGNYEIQVYAEDKAKHTSGIASRSFSIDNTPPVLVITNPTTAGNDKTPAAFGQIVQITGSFYDFCGKLTNLTVSFYDENGKAICDSDFSNITSMSDASPLVIARYFADADQQKENQKIFDNYCALLGTAKIADYEQGTEFDDVRIYFSVTASDDAKVFKTVGDNGTGNGNLTKEYYRGTTSMQNLVSGDGGIDNFSLADFASYLNKTSTAFNSDSQLIDSTANSARSYSTTAVSVPDIGAYINNADSSNGDSVYLTYTVNPMNNPYFTVGGYEVVSTEVAATDDSTYSPEGYKKVYNGAPIPVSVSVGKDQKNISTHTVTVYRVDVTKYSGEITKAMFTGVAGLANYEAGYFDVLCTWDEAVKNEFNAWGKSLPSSCYIQTSEDANVSSISKQLTVDFQNANDNYLFYIVGKDITGNDLVAANSYGYGFCGTTATTAATITLKDGNKLNDVVNLYKFKGEPVPPKQALSALSEVLYLHGEITTEETLNELTYTLTVSNSSAPTKTYTKNGVIDISVITPPQTAPSYSSDFTSTYCYTLTGDSAKKTYEWRWTAASSANEFISNNTLQLLTEGSYDVNFVLTADNGAKSTYQRTFTIDNEKPKTELSDITPSANHTGGGYWINPEKDLAISGLVSDNLTTSKKCQTWIKLVALDAGSHDEVDDDAAVYITPETHGDSKWVISVSKDNLPAKNSSSEYYYGVNLYIYSQDEAGNIGVSETPVTTLYFDTVAPKGKHALDGKNKDLFFRVGSFNNDDISKAANPTLWDDDLDTDVGGKYQENTYGNTTTIKLRGTFEEEGSGLNMIYYKIINSPTTLDYDTLKTTAQNFLTNYNKASDYTGYFAPLAADSEEERRVFYTSVNGTDGNIPKKYIDTDGNIQTSPTINEVSSSDYVVDSKGKKKYYTNIVSNYDAVLSGFSTEGTNYIILVAEDKVGNAALDTVLTDKVYYNASINVDAESPILVCSSHNGQEYTNGVSPITVSGTYNDLPSAKNSGVSKISVELNGVSAPATLDNGTWTATLLASTLNSLDEDKPYNVNGTITDNAGNSSSATLFTLSYDTTAPVVEVKSPATGSNINGLMTLNGSVTYDGSSPNNLVLYATTEVPSGDFTNFQHVKTINTQSQIFSWSISNIDTYELTCVEAAPVTSNLYFVPVVTDNAGNNNVFDLETSTYKYTENTNYFKYTVDMNSNRPTVKVTNLTKSDDDSYILKYGDNAKIEGTVSDDDATSTRVVKQFIASSSPIADNNIFQNSTTTEYTITGATGNTTYNPSTGEWTFTPANTDDGEKSVYFYIVDNADELFYTGKIETVNSTDYKYHQPYFQFKTSTAEDNSSALTYNSDATAPTVSALLQAYKSDGTTKNGDEVSPGPSITLGGTEKQYAQFKITGSDANGIEGIKLTLTYKSKTDSTEKTICISSVSGYQGFTESGSTENSSTDSKWTTALIDLTDYDTGTVTGAIEVYDKSGLLGTSSQIFAVDNDGPGATITSPGSEELTGDITFAGTSTDTGNAGVESTAWLIPTKTQAAMSDAALSAAVDGSGNSIWNSNYDGDKTALVWAFTLEAGTLAAYDSATYTSNIVNDVYILPFYVMTKDKLGNYKIDRTKTFKHNPNADRPKTEIIYPNDKNYGTDQNGNKVQYVTLGGSIRISGSAIIPSNTTTVDSVYVQVVNGSANLSGSQTIDDNYTLTSAWASSHGCTIMTKSQVQTAVGKTLSFADNFDWGIKADKTAAWSLTINDNGEMNPDSGQLTYIAIRACAVNADGKVGAWSDWYYVNIDDTAPSQEPMLYQFKTTNPSTGCAAADIIASTNITASRTYEADMYLKGDWYLVIKLHDESSLKSYSVKKNNAELADGTKYYHSELATGDDGKEKTQYLFIPVEVEQNESSITYTVMVEDTDHKISDTYSLNIDNDAPEITKIYKGSTDTAANYLDADSTNIIADSNYVYTMGGKVSESGSGFERLVFYYVRANAIDGQTYETEAVLDPLITTGTSNAKAAISGLKQRPFIQGSNTYYLYSKEVAGTLGADGFTFTATTASDITSNAHIRAGGLIEVNGLLRRIESISAATVTFRESTGVTAATPATAYFPYAQVVDNFTTEKVTSQSANPFTFESDDDDKMPETLTGSKSLGFTWDATVHSYNMPDGPCALVVLAFDKAGNVSGKTYKAKVENSAPRLAKVFLGTDLNSSGTWKTSDFIGYNVYDANNTHGIASDGVKAAQKISTASYGSAFTIKDKLAVVAEIVGGNGEIMMVYGKGATTTAAVPSSGTEAGITATANADLAALVQSDKIGTVIYNNADKTTALKGFTLTNEQIVETVSESNDGTGKSASFTFWDHTDELNAGTTSQNCVLLVDDFTIDLVDSVAPKVVVNPFYWASASENSLYGNSSANGHIELEGDLTGTAALTLYGSDPKVSGKITFTGTAYDEHALKNLTFSLTNSSGTALEGFSNISMGTYDPTNATYAANGSWSALSGNSGSAVSAGGKYEWTISQNNTGTEQKAGHYDDTYYLSQVGHKIYWTISIDTAQIPNVAQTDVKLTVTATQLSDNTPAAATVTSTTPSTDKLDAKDNHVPTYQMDIVPYITKISTGVRTASGLKDNNIRSASGKYSILANNVENTITVSGFNFSTTALVAKIANAATSAGTGITNTTGGTAVTIAATDSTTAIITNSGITKSGYLELFSNTVRTLNNINGNDSYGTAKNSSDVQLTAGNATVSDYASAYNREPDYYTTKNVQLTDDRYLLFFDMKDTGIKNGYYPVMVMSKENNRKDNPVFGYVDLKGGSVNTTTTSPYYGAGTNNTGHFPSYSMPQRAEFSANNGNPVYVEYLNKGSTWDQMGMAVDEGGRYYNVSVYNRDNCNMDFIYDKFSELHTSTTTSGGFMGQTTTYNLGWGSGVTIGNSNYTYSRTMAYSTNNNAITLESVNYNELGIGRYQYPKIVTLGNSRTGTAKVYMMYYDDGIYDPNHTNRTGGLIFRDFQIGTTVSGTAKNLYNGDTKDNENRAYAQKYNFTENTDGGDDTYTETYRHIAADNASNNFSFDVTSSGVVVFAYYDVSLSRLVLKYSSSAIDGSAPGTAPNWTTSSVQFPDNVGTYVSLVLDGNAVHISAFDSYDSNLVYMYLPTYSSTAMQAITVDQASSVGNWTQIKIKDHKPYIAYYNSTETGGRDGIKLAYSINQITGSDITVPFGVDNKPGTSLGANGINAATGYTTGSWEYMTVPALTPPQGGDPKFQNVCLDFDSNELPVVGYLGTNLEFGKWFTE